MERTKEQEKVRKAGQICDSWVPSGTTAGVCFGLERPPFKLGVPPGRGLPRCLAMLA